MDVSETGKSLENGGEKKANGEVESGSAANAGRVGPNIPKASPPIPVLSTSDRNYASKECGAKVILANPAAQHTQAIVNG